MVRRSIVAGNWKMNGSLDANQTLLTSVYSGLRKQDSQSAQILVFPPFAYLSQIANLIAKCSDGSDSLIGCGAQNVSEHDKGAYTGEISATMLTDIGCSHVLVGHSERRSLYHESSEVVASKFAIATAAGLTPVLCLGESLGEREAGRTMEVVFEQLDAVINRVGVSELSNAIIAYEPVWAIGTGKTATPEQAQEVHQKIRSHIAQRDQAVASQLHILYGGSVNATNATEIFAKQDIDGGLIGGASLKADDFLKICVAAG